MSGRGSRTRTRLRSAARAAAVATVLCGAYAAPAQAALPDDFWGVVPINEPNRSEFDRMGKGGVAMLRQLTLWPSLEPKKDEYNWGWLDYVVENSARNGIEVFPFVYGTPGWARGGCGGLDDDTCMRYPPLKKTSLQAWQDLLRDFVARYGPNGEFWQQNPDVPHVPITNVQVWNEPSSITYWRPRPKPKKYAKLVRASDNAIEDVDPSVEVVLAGLFPSPEGGDKYNYKNYLEDFYDARGIKKSFDAAAFHPYAKTIGILRSQVSTMRKLMKQGGARGRQLWITEIGWGSDPPQPGRPLIKGIDGQRDLLEQSFNLLRQSQNRWKLAGVMWYSWRDPGVGYENCPFCSSSGLFKENGDAKPSWHAYVQETGGKDEPNPPEEYQP